MHEWLLAMIRSHPPIAASTYEGLPALLPLLNPPDLRFRAWPLLGFEAASELSLRAISEYGFVTASVMGLRAEFVLDWRAASVFGLFPASCLDWRGAPVFGLRAASAFGLRAASAFGLAGLDAADLPLPGLDEPDFGVGSTLAALNAPDIGKAWSFTSGMDFPISFSISRRKGTSSTSQNDIAVPLSPARPVRPIQCTYVSGMFGRLKLMTCDSSSMSIPRAAISVATRTRVAPL